MQVRTMAAAALLALCAPAAARAQSGGYVALLGRDTVVVERFSWSADSLTGVNVIRTPRTMVRTYGIAFAPGGAPRSFHMTMARPGQPAMQEVRFDYYGDTVYVTVRRDTIGARYGVVAPGAPLPFFEDIFSPWAVAVRRASGDSATFVAGRRPLRFGLVREPGVLRFTWPEWGTAVARTDATGQLLGLDFTGTTSKYIVQSVPPMDVQALAASFAAREQAGSGLGTLSPRDTARADLAGAHILVDYGRPSARGRTIFGGVVPWGQVWRTGANAATQLVTDRELVIGGLTVPAGTYTLFTIPAQNGAWQLAINRQHGQWGTQYDPAQDLGRVTLHTTNVSPPVERFTFEIPPAPGGGTLAFAWGDRRAEVPFTVK